MEEKYDALDDQEKQRLENEIRKMKMSLEKGARFSETNSDLPPDPENIFLNHIEKFDEAFKNVYF